MTGDSWRRGPRPRLREPEQTVLDDDGDDDGDDEDDGDDDDGDDGDDDTGLQAWQKPQVRDSCLFLANWKLRGRFPLPSLITRSLL